MPVPKRTTLPHFRVQRWTDKRGIPHEYYNYEHPRDENGKRRREPLGADKVKALLRYAELEQKKPAEVGIDPNDFSVAATYNRYMKWAEVKADSGLSDRTIRDRKTYWKTLEPVFGAQHIDGLLPEHMLQYFDARSSKSSAKKEIKFVSVFCGWARGRGWMKAPNPVTRDALRQMKVDEHRDIYVTDGLYWLVHDCGDWLVQDTLDFALLNYLRPAEAFKPEWPTLHKDAAGAEEIWHTLPKTAKSGVRIKRVRVVGRLKDLITRIRKRILASTVRSRTILSDEAGQPLRQGGKFRYRFYKARDAAQARIRELLAQHGEAWIIEKGLPVPPALAPGARDRFLVDLIQFRDMRPKAATDSERRDGMPATRRRLGHTTEAQTADYVRDKVGELVDPGVIERPAWMDDALKVASG